MLKYGLFGAVVTVIALTLGVNLLLTEPTPIKWMGLLAILGGVVVALRSWAALSLYAEEASGKQPPWHIQRVLSAHQS